MTDLLRYRLIQAQRLCRRRPRTTLVCAFVILLASLSLASRLQFLLSIDDLIDPDFSTYQSLKTLNNEFHDKNTVLLSVESDQDLTKPFLCDLQGWILETASSRRDLIEIRSSFGIPRPVVGTHEFRLPSALQLDCDHLANPETEKIQAGLNWIRQSPWRDVLSLPNRAGISVIFLVYDPQDKKYGSVDTKVVAELSQSFKNRFGSRYPQLEAHWGGVTTYQSHLRNAFDQTLALNGLMFVIAFLIFRIFLGSWSAGLIFNASAILTLMFTYGLMGLARIPVDVLTNSIGMMTIVACLEDVVFVAYGVKKFGWSLEKSLRRFLVPSFFTSLATVVGFESLLVSDLGIVRRFGAIAGFAAMTEWAVVFLLLPALIRWKPRWRIFAFRGQSRSFNLRRFAHVKGNPRWAWGFVVAVLLPMVFIARLHVEDSPADFFSKRHPARSTLDHLLQTRGWINEVSLLFNSKNSEDRNRQILRQWSQVPEIHRIESTEAAKGFLANGLDAADSRLMSRLWDDSHSARRLESSDGTQRAELYLNTMDMQKVRSVIEKSHAICPNRECELAGSLISYNEFSVRVLQTLFSSLGLSLLLMAGILFMISRHLKKRDLVACLISAVWGPCALLAIFVIFNIPLFFVSCVCASVLVGLAGDNAVQFVFQSRRSNLPNAVDTLAEASLIITVGMIMLTCVFFLSDMAPLTKLGGLMILGFILGYAGDVILLKGLLSRESR